jgi:guanine deaminase
MATTVYLGTLAHVTANPFYTDKALEIIQKGALWVDEQGRIIEYGECDKILAKEGLATIKDYSSAWLIPGLVDGHIHFPQYYATAAYGGQLLDWLVQSILPAETAYADATFAQAAAQQFVAHLLACGTTTALVFGSQFFDANLALFEAAKAAGLRLIAGPTLMDIAAPGIPSAFLTTTRQAQDDAESLLAYCCNEPLLHYAITPRYALSCSPEMMAFCADLLQRYPEAYLQTHINENHGEIAAVLGHFSACADYLAVYEQFGLITPRTMLAHSIHTTEAELQRIAQSDCAVCHCPASNLYLGSGLFPLHQHLQHGIRVAVGTDIGAGPRFSIWRNLADAYNIQQLQGMTLDAAALLYLGTLAGAEALNLQQETGNFAPGKSADFWLLNASEAGYLSQRLEHCDDLAAQLFCLLHLATEQQVTATFVQGRQVFGNPAKIGGF